MPWDHRSDRQRPSAARDPGCCLMPVYIIRAGEHGPVKIGFADDVDLRLSKMQSDNHERLTVLRMLVGGMVEETSLHLRFAPLRLHGEWFAFSREMLTDLGLDEIEAPARPSEVRAAVAAAHIAADTVAPLFGQRIKAGRRAARMTQGELARRVGVARSTLAEYEGDEHSPSVARIAAIASALGVSTDWLLAVTKAAA